MFNLLQTLSLSLSHTHTQTHNDKQALLFALGVIVREQHIRNLSENNVGHSVPSQHPWHCFTPADKNMQVLTYWSIHNYKRPHPTASIT